jgi:hypothetical protein
MCYLEPLLPGANTPQYFKVIILKTKFRTYKALIALSNSLGLCFLMNIPDVEKFVSFCVGRIVNSASKSIFKLGASSRRGHEYSTCNMATVLPVLPTDFSLDVTQRAHSDDIAC